MHRSIRPSRTVQFSTPLAQCAAIPRVPGAMARSVWVDGERAGLPTPRKLPGGWRERPSRIHCRPGDHNPAGSQRLTHRTRRSSRHVRHCSHRYRESRMPDFNRSYRLAVVCALRSDNADARYPQGARHQHEDTCKLAHLSQPRTTVVNRARRSSPDRNEKQDSGPRRSSLERDKERDGFARLRWEETREGNTFGGARLTIETGADFPIGIRA